MHAKETIQLIAESLLPGFIPKDPAAETLVFHFTIPPRSNYRVSFNKDKKGNWIFDNYVEDHPES